MKKTIPLRIALFLSLVWLGINISYAQDNASVGQLNEILRQELTRDQPGDHCRSEWQ